jgi:hypothetical protein
MSLPSEGLPQQRSMSESAKSFWHRKQQCKEKMAPMRPRDLFRSPLWNRLSRPGSDRLILVLAAAHVAIFAACVLSGLLTGNQAFLLAVSLTASWVAGSIVFRLPHAVLAKTITIYLLLTFTLKLPFCLIWPHHTYLRLLPNCHDPNSEPLDSKQSELIRGNNLVETFDASYYADASKLYDAYTPGSENDREETDLGFRSPTGAPVEAMERKAYNLCRFLLLSGGDSFDWGGAREEWMWGNTTHAWYFITPDGKLYKWLGSRSEESLVSGSELAGEFDRRYYADPSKLYNAYPLSQRACDLDEKLGLEFRDSYNEDWGGAKERWIWSRSANTWCFITPEGRFYEWNEPDDGPNFLSGSGLVATRNASDYSRLRDQPASVGELTDTICRKFSFFAMGMVGFAIATFIASRLISNLVRGQSVRTETPAPSAVFSVLAVACVCLLGLRAFLLLDLHVGVPGIVPPVMFVPNLTGVLLLLSTTGATVLVMALVALAINQQSWHAFAFASACLALYVGIDIAGGWRGPLFRAGFCALWLFLFLEHNRFKAKLKPIMFLLVVLGPVLFAPAMMLRYSLLSNDFDFKRSIASVAKLGLDTGGTFRDHALTFANRFNGLDIYVAAVESFRGNPLGASHLLSEEAVTHFTREVYGKQRNNGGSFAVTFWGLWAAGFGASWLFTGGVVLGTVIGLATYVCHRLIRSRFMLVVAQCNLAIFFLRVVMSGNGAELLFKELLILTGVIAGLNLLWTQGAAGIRRFRAAATMALSRVNNDSAVAGRRQVNRKEGSVVP